MAITNGDPLTFDRTVAEYANGRPPYPTSLFEYLADAGIIGPGRRVLEIGPGTGLVTRELLDRGTAVDAVELGHNLADHLSRTIDDDGFSIHVGDAATIPLPADHYDGVVAATSFHWLDADAVLPRLLAAIRPGGAIALWWAVYHDPDDRTPLQQAIHRIYQTRIPESATDEIPRPLEVAARTQELARAKFVDVEHRVIRWSVELTGADIRDLYASFPAIENQPAEVRELVLNDILEAAGGPAARVTERYLVSLYLARRAA